MLYTVHARLINVSMREYAGSTKTRHSDVRVQKVRTVLTPLAYYTAFIFHTNKLFVVQLMANTVKYWWFFTELYVYVMVNCFRFYWSDVRG